MKRIAIALFLTACGREGVDPAPTPTPTASPTPRPCALEVGGVLGGLHTWSDGPVCVTNDLFLAPGASLGVAGVEVKILGSYAIVLQGGSRMTAVDARFVSGMETPRPGDWGPILADAATEVTLRRTMLSHGSGLFAYDATVTIEDSTFLANDAATPPAILTVEGASATLTMTGSAMDESAAACVAVLRASATIERNRIASCMGDALLVFALASDAPPVVRRNLLAFSDTGLRLDGGLFASAISRNVFQGNSTGIRVEGGSRFDASDNHLLDAVAIRAQSPGSSSALNNWWGTTDPAEIEARIVNAPSHSISFDPFRLAPVAGAGP